MMKKTNFLCHLQHAQTHAHHCLEHFHFHMEVVEEAVSPVDLPVMDATVMDLPVMDLPVLDLPVMVITIMDLPVMGVTVMDLPVMGVTVMEIPVMGVTVMEIPAMGVTVMVVTAEVSISLILFKKYSDNILQNKESVYSSSRGGWGAKSL